MLDDYGEELIQQLVADRIRAARKRRDMSQRELAEDLDMTQQNISEIEQGERSLGLELLERVSKALDTQLTVLFEPNDPGDLDEDEYIDTRFALPVALLRRLHEKAATRAVATDEYLKTLLEDHLEQTESGL